MTPATVQNILSGTAKSEVTAPSASFSCWKHPGNGGQTTEIILAPAHMHTHSSNSRISVFKTFGGELVPKVFIPQHLSTSRTIKSDTGPWRWWLKITFQQLFNIFFLSSWNTSWKKAHSGGECMSKAITSLQSFLGQKHPRLTSYLILFPFLFLSFTHGNRKKKGPTEGKNRSQNKH